MNKKYINNRLIDIYGDASFFNNTLIAEALYNEHSIAENELINYVLEKGGKYEAGGFFNLAIYISQNLGVSYDDVVNFFSGEQMISLGLYLRNCEVPEKKNGIIIADTTGYGKTRSIAGAMMYAHKNKTIPLIVLSKREAVNSLYGELITLNNRTLMKKEEDRVLLKTGMIQTLRFFSKSNMTNVSEINYSYLNSKNELEKIPIFNPKKYMRGLDKKFMDEILNDNDFVEFFILTNIEKEYDWQNLSDKYLFSKSEYYAIKNIAEKVFNDDELEHISENKIFSLENASKLSDIAFSFYEKNEKNEELINSSLLKGVEDAYYKIMAIKKNKNISSGDRDEKILKVKESVFSSIVSKSKAKKINEKDKYVLDTIKKAFLTYQYLRLIETANDDRFNKYVNDLKEKLYQASVKNGIFFFLEFYTNLSKKFNRLNIEDLIEYNDKKKIFNIKDRSKDFETYFYYKIAFALCDKILDECHNIFGSYQTDRETQTFKNLKKFVFDIDNNTIIPKLVYPNTNTMFLSATPFKNIELYRVYSTYTLLDDFIKKHWDAYKEVYKNENAGLINKELTKSLTKNGYYVSRVSAQPTPYYKMINNYKGERISKIYDEYVSYFRNKKLTSELIKSIPLLFYYFLIEMKIDLDELTPEERYEISYNIFRFSRELHELINQSYFYYIDENGEKKLAVSEEHNRDLFNYLNTQKLKVRLDEILSLEIKTIGEEKIDKSNAFIYATIIANGLFGLSDDFINNFIKEEYVYLFHELKQHYGLIISSKSQLEKTGDKSKVYELEKQFNEIGLKNEIDELISKKQFNAQNLKKLFLKDEYFNEYIFDENLLMKIFSNQYDKYKHRPLYIYFNFFKNKKDFFSNKFAKLTITNIKSDAVIDFIAYNEGFESKEYDFSWLKDDRGKSKYVISYPKTQDSELRGMRVYAEENGLDKVRNDIYEYIDFLEYKSTGSYFDFENRDGVKYTYTSNYVGDKDVKDLENDILDVIRKTYDYFNAEIDNNLLKIFDDNVSFEERAGVLPEINIFGNAISSMSFVGITEYLKKQQIERRTKQSVPLFIYEDLAIKLHHRFSGKYKILKISGKKDYFLYEEDENGNLTNEGVILNVQEIFQLYNEILRDEGKSERVLKKEEIEEQIREIDIDMEEEEMELMEGEKEEEEMESDEYKGREENVRGDMFRYALNNKEKFKKSVEALLSFITINKNEAIEKFNNEKEYKVIIINQSGSESISLHASKMFADQTRRAMIILEAEANEINEKQKRGRINRKGQVSEPIYYYPYTDVPYEKRLILMLKNKMKHLEITTAGDVNKDDFNAEELKKLENLENDYVRIYLEQLLLDKRTDHIINTIITIFLKIRFETNNRGELIVSTKSDLLSSFLSRYFIFNTREQDLLINDIINYNYSIQKNVVDKDVYTINVDDKDITQAYSKTEYNDTIYAINTNIEMQNNTLDLKESVERTLKEISDSGYDGLFNVYFQSFLSLDFVPQNFFNLVENVRRGVLLSDNNYLKLIILLKRFYHFIYYNGVIYSYEALIDIIKLHKEEAIRSKNEGVEKFFYLDESNYDIILNVLETKLSLIKEYTEKNSIYETLSDEQIELLPEGQRNLLIEGNKVFIVKENYSDFIRDVNMNDLISEYGDYIRKLIKNVKEKSDELYRTYFATVSEKTLFDEEKIMQLVKSKEELFKDSMPYFYLLSQEPYKNFEKEFEYIFLYKNLLPSQKKVIKLSYFEFLQDVQNVYYFYRGFLRKDIVETITKVFRPYTNSLLGKYKRANLITLKNLVFNQNENIIQEVENEKKEEGKGEGKTLKVATGSEELIKVYEATNVEKVYSVIYEKVKKFFDKEYYSKKKYKEGISDEEYKKILFNITEKMIASYTGSVLNEIKRIDFYEKENLYDYLDEVLSYDKDLLLSLTYTHGDFQFSVSISVNTKLLLESIDKQKLIKAIKQRIISKLSIYIKEPQIVFIKKITHLRIGDVYYVSNIRNRELKELNPELSLLVLFEDEERETFMYLKDIRFSNYTLKFDFDIVVNGYMSEKSHFIEYSKFIKAGFIEKSIDNHYKGNLKIKFIDEYIKTTSSKVKRPVVIFYGDFLYLALYSLYLRYARKQRLDLIGRAFETLRDMFLKSNKEVKLVPMFKYFNININKDGETIKLFRQCVYATTGVHKISVKSDASNTKVTLDKFDNVLNNILLKND